MQGPPPPGYFAPPRPPMPPIMMMGLPPAPAGPLLPPPVPPRPPMLPPMMPAKLPKGVTDLGTPEEWVERTDAKSDRTYYYNRRTRERCWKNPFPFLKLSGRAEPRAAIGSVRVPGSDWCEVGTNDGRTFYFNTETKVSTYTLPDEVTAAREKERARLAQIAIEEASAATAAALASVGTTTTTTETAAKEEEPFADIDMDATIAMMQEEAAREAAEAAAREQELEEATRDMTTEDRQAYFFDLLSECQVSALSSWHKEKQKVEGDWRFSLVGIAREQEDLFNRWAKDHMEEERQRKQRTLLRAKNAFFDLLEETVLTARMSFREFMQKAFKDDRYKSVERPKEREKLFQEHVKTLKSGKKRVRESTEELERESQSDRKRAKQNDWESEFRTVLQARSTMSDAQWSVTYASLKRESAPVFVRLESAMGAGKLERVFNDYCERKKQRMRQAMASRSTVVRESQAELERARRRGRENVRRTEAEEAWKALLRDAVREMTDTWSDVQSRLSQSTEYTQALSAGLSPSQLEALFTDHLWSLHQRRVSDFHSEIERVCTTLSIPLTAEWPLIQPHIAQSVLSRLIRGPDSISDSDEKHRQTLYYQYRAQRIERAKAQFIQLLKETRAISHLSRELLEGAKSEDHSEEINHALSKDQRFHAMSCLEIERAQLLREYINTLADKGTPPPPTAQESTAHAHINK